MIEMTSNLIYELGDDTSDSSALSSHHTDLASMEDRDLRRGDSVLNYWDPNAVFVMEKDNEKDCVAVDALEPVFSDRLKRIMEANNITNVEYYPMNVEHVDGRSLGQYWYVHVLKTEGVLDLERSIYKRFHVEGIDKEAFMLIKPVLRADAVASIDLFRIPEAIGGVYVSDRFRRLFLDNGCKGTVFYPQKVV